MTYFADLTAYEFLPGRPPALNVGWLDDEHPFPQGDLPVELRSKVSELAVVAPTNQTRGAHLCELCAEVSHTSNPQAVWRGQSRVLGTAEIWVTSIAGVSYACPDLIVHYIDAHGYLPPEEFVEALTALSSVST